MLVAAARRGDKDAFAVLVERHRPMALAVAGKVLPDGGAVDVVQEAAVTAYVGLERLRAPDRFGSWFTGIAVNTARRWLRDALRESAPFADLHGDEQDRPRQGDELDPAEGALRADIARRVREAVAHLAPGQRDAVLAFYWLGLSHAGAATELGVSPGAVKARLHQARAALATTLAPQMLHDSPDEPDNLEADPMPAPSEPPWIEVEILDVRRSSVPDPAVPRFHAIILRECEGDRHAAIYVGAFEATALAFNLEPVEMPRPMTYAMAAQLAAAAGSTIVDVRISRLAESVVYAVIHIDGPQGTAEVDARPSDALNLALVCGATVLVHSSVFDALADCALRDWKGFPTGAQALVTEARAYQARVMAMGSEAMTRQVAQDAKSKSKSKSKSKGASTTIPA